MARVLLIAILCGLLYLKGVCPLVGEVEHFRYKKAFASGQLDAAERHILKALKFDHRNTVWLFCAAQIYGIKGNPWGACSYVDDALRHYNGDIVMWSLHYMRGIYRLQLGSIMEAREAFDTALYYNPEFGEARARLEETERIIREHDRVLVRFR